MALHLALDHVARRPGAGSCGPNTSATSRRCSKPSSSAASQRVVRRRRVLGEERDVLALGQLHHQVARAAVGELALVDRVDAGAVALGDLQRAVGRAGVHDQQLDLAVDALARGPRPSTSSR